MSKYHTHWRILLVSLCILGLTPVSQARKGQEEDNYEPVPRKYEKGTSLKNPKYQEPRKHDKQPIKQKSYQQKSKKYNEKKSNKHYQNREQPRKDRIQTQPSVRHDRDRDRSQPRRPAQTQRGLWPYPDRSALPAHRSRTRNSHDRHYDRYTIKLRAARHYRPHETYRYHTHYLAPIRHHYHPTGHRLRVLPRSYLRIVVHGLPYFYFGGVFYRNHVSGYIVVRAPIGAVVSVLPVGFIAFSLGGVTYYHANDTYYLWDDGREVYYVVEKPRGADSAIAKATGSRLYVYPEQGQSEEQQAKDRYECHRWAVRETGVDPTLDDEEELSSRDERDYKRAITACLEGRGYSVK